jgi:hypothetical protein
MQLFATLPPVHGAILWTIANVLIVLLLGLRISQHCPEWDRPTIILLLFGSYPIVVTLLVGQFQIIMAWALTECFLALRAGKDFQAGVWLGLLLLKPHYGILLGPLLIWKQRWRAVVGVAATGLVLLGVSVVAVGFPALMAYPQSFSVMAQFRGDDPSVMINWRALLLEIKPEISDRGGVVLSIALGCLTVACTALMWRGPWHPGSSTFALQFSAVTLATLLVNYHSHPYGAVLTLVPLAFAVMTGRATKLSHAIALCASIIPTLILTVGYGSSVTGGNFYTHLYWASRLLKGLLFLLFLCLLRDSVVSTEMWTMTVRPSTLQFWRLKTLPDQLTSLVASHRRAAGRARERR